MNKNIENMTTKEIGKKIKENRRVRTVMIDVAGFQPNQKQAVKRGKELYIDNRMGKGVAVALNDRNANSDGICQVQARIMKFSPSEENVNGS